MHWDEVSSGWHDDYERGRPGYPAASVRVAGVSPSAQVLELGAGTGKLTRLLVDQFARVTAVEPDPGMRRLLMARCPRATLIAGSAEQIPIASASVDGVFVAEAFHWFDHARALVDIARVLRPEGTVVLMWNRPAGGPQPPIAEVEELLRPIWPQDIDMPLDLDPRQMPHARDWPRAFARSPFEPLHEATFPNPTRFDQRALVAFFGSMGWISALPEQQRAPLLDEVRSRLTAGEYVLPFETHVHWARLASP